MKKYLTPALAVIAVIAIVFCFVFNGQKGDLQKTVDDVKAQLETLKTESEAKIAEAESAKTAAEEQLETLKTESEAKVAEAEAAKTAAEEQLETLKTESEAKVAELTKQLEEAAAAAAAGAAETVEKAEETVKDAAAEVADAAAETAEKAEEAVKDAAAEVADAAAETAEKAEEAVKDAAAEVADAAAETAEKVEEAAAEVAEAAAEPAVMTHAEFIAAANDTEVVVESYVQAHQNWWDNKVTVYLQDPDGAYFAYEMKCSEEDAAKLVPGQKIRVKGFKGEWGGEIEIMDGSFEFVEAEPWIAEAEDVTALLAKEELADHMNKFVAVKGATVAAQDDGTAFAYKNPEEKTDDLYFAVDVDGKTYNFCVEFYLCGKDTDVYKAVEGLKVGDVVDLEGFLYWYNGANIHTTKLIVK
ncbi:MAG: hypothetical protein K5922_06550 [Clostridiales bacterium]|nr:hypothetical protein [Clostridiales bacterium]